jgi:DegV family protein with EDD domain
MRIGIVVDSACDLPQSFIRENGIIVLPTSVYVEPNVILDDRDPGKALAFYSEHMANASRGETTPLAPEQIQRLFLDRLVLDYDAVFCLTIASSRSTTYENVLKASFAVLSGYKPIRDRAGLNTPFALRVVDTQNLFAAQAVTAIETVRLVKAGASPLHVRDRLEELVPQVYGYMLPASLHHMFTRAQTRGDKSVGWFKYTVGKMLDIKPIVRGFRNETAAVVNARNFEDGCRRLFQFVIRRIEAGLLTPALVVSYGGEPRALHYFPGYDDMIEAAKKAGVEVYISVASITAAVNVGEGAIIIGFAAPEHEADI